MKQLVLALGAAPAPSLENFVAGRNAAALAALESLAPGAVVYLYGEKGCGKTHLVRALEAIWLAEADPTPHLSADDVHTLAPEAQIELFVAFNRTRAQDGVVVAAGDVAPLELKLREDLRTRLGSGLVFQLHALNEAEKRDALRRHAAQRGLRLGDEILNYLLTHLRRDMPTQVAVLDAIDRHALETKRPITLPLVREALQSMDTTGT
jgi:DnaA-homolog protein